MAGEARRTAKKVRTVSQKMVAAGAKKAAVPILQSFRTDSGGDLNLSGTRSAWKFKTPTRVRGDANAVGTARITPGGPAAWLNSGAKRRNGRTRPKRTFVRAVPEAIDAARTEVRRVFHEEVG